MVFLEIAAAHNLAALGRIEDIKLALESVGSKRSAPRLMLESILAQYSGDLDKCIAGLYSCLKLVSEREHGYVIDLLAPVLITRGDLARAWQLLEEVRESGNDLAALLESLRDIIRVRRGDQTSLTRLEPERESEVSRARILQRIGTALFYASSFEDAIEAARKAARIFDRIGAHRSSAAAYSIVYSVQQVAQGDIEEAYKTAQLISAAAEKGDDRSFRMAGLVAQYEIAAEFGDAAAVVQLRNLINRGSLPTQYEERFARGIADTLPFSWSGDFAAFRANAAMLRDLSTNRAMISLSIALRALGEAALGDVVSSRRSSRSAIGMAAHADEGETPYDLRYRRLARAISAATCVLIGDANRGRRAMEARLFRNADMIEIVLAADGNDWSLCPRRIRGYARSVAAAREALFMIVGHGLTTTEVDVLRMLAEGKSAPAVAAELDRSVHTVRAHTRNIIDKLNVSGRGAAINIARKIGIIP